MGDKNQSKNIFKMVLWGVFSFVLYFILFSNQQMVTDYFTRGGAFAVAVLVIALAFSVVYGTFANYFLESLGMRAVKKGGH